MRETTEQSYQERLLRVQMYIQEHLDEDLKLEVLARIAHFSPYHFHRIFRGMTGESVTGHIRRLRLERAAMLLRGSRRSVTRLAFEAGYNSHEAFTRAFQTRFGMTPSDYRRKTGAEDVESAVKFVLPGKRKRSLGRYILNRTGEEAMNIEVRELAEFRVACVRHVGPYEECKKAWDALCNWAGPRGLIRQDTRFFGISHDDPDVTAPEHIRYDACLTVEREVDGAGIVSVQTIGGGRYAMAIHKGPYEKLADTYAVLCGQWAAQNGFELRESPCIEEYLNSPDTTKPEDLLTNVYVPIE